MSAAVAKRTSNTVKTAKVTMIVISSVAVLLCLLLVFKGQDLSKKISANENRMVVINRQIEEEKQRTQEIEELSEYMESDEYIERTAKDKLGLIKDGEIIFKESN